MANLEKCNKTLHSTYANEVLSRISSIFLRGVVALIMRLLLVPIVDALASKTNLE